MRWALTVTVGLLPLLAGCGGSPTPVPSPTPTPGLSRLSGTWTGTVTLTQLGTCPIPGAPTLPVTMAWTVTDAGDTVIDQGQTQWNGRISTDLTGTLTMVSAAICGQTGRPYTAQYPAAIRFEGGRYNLDMQATEEWCPPDCIYRLRYVIMK